MLSKYWKAVIALAAIAGTAVGTTAADPNVNAVLPEGWGAAVASAGTAIGTFLVWLKRNEPTVKEAEEILERARERAGLNSD